MRLELDLATAWPGFRLAVATELELTGITALFGPSGSGKTSTLQAVAGFRPGIGRIAVAGEVWQDGHRMRPPHRRPVGLVFQDGRLFEHLDVAGNLRFAEKRADQEGPKIDRAELTGLLGLDDLLSRRVPTLSGGERQRVAIARALLTRPRIMLMDEPLAALDRARKADVLPLIAALPDRFGVPVLFVSHLIDEIAQIADQLVAIRAGKIAGQGPTLEMLEALEPEITGRFEAGALLEGPLIEVAPGYGMAAVEIGGVPLWTPAPAEAALGDRVRLRLRARDVSLALQRLDGLSMRNQLPVIVTGIETDDGPFAEVRLDCAGQPLRARISRMALDDLALRPGQEVVALIKSIAFDRRLARR